MANTILITGGSGLVGTSLSAHLASRGYQVAHLSRYKRKSTLYPTFAWDLTRNSIEEGAFNAVDYIVHLAGAGVADKRWTKERKQVLASSRIDTARLIHQNLQKSGRKIKGFISASAIGIYGFDTGEIVQTEDRTQLGDDFLATLTKQWEEAADRFQDISDRVVKYRIGLVLSNNGGLLDKLLPITKLGLGSALGSGHQYMSWIHEHDLIGIFTKAIEDSDLNGVYNAVAPHPVTNESFMKALAKTVNRPLFLPNAPKFALQMALGELASAVTGGNRVSAEKIQQAGFTFKYPQLSHALADLLKRQSN
jgi:uncharacterized protein (TIGR01777 family)